MAISPEVQRSIDRSNEAQYTPETDLNRMIAAQLSGGQPSSTDPGYTQFRRVNVTNTAVEVKPTSGNIYGWNITNLSGSSVFIKFFNAAAASVIPGTTVPKMTLLIPANGAILYSEARFPFFFDASISVLATTVGADTGTQTAASPLPIIEVWYK